MTIPLLARFSKIEKVEPKPEKITKSVTEENGFEFGRRSATKRNCAAK
jgi:hypothetical protein